MSMKEPSKTVRYTKVAMSALADEIVATVRARILSWHYPPRYRLTEELLCSEFKVSRSPAREALRILEADGYLSRLSNRGFAVKQPDLREVEELYQVLSALELYAIQIVAEQKLGAPEISALGKIWKAVKAGSDRDGETVAKLDVSFHETLTSLLGNRTLDERLKEVNARLFAFRLIDFAQPGRIAVGCDEHLKVLDCLKLGDAKGARDALMINIEGSRATARATLLEALSRSYENI